MVDVQPARRLVRDQQLGAGAQRHRDEHALRHAAADLVGVGIDPALRVVQPEPAQHVDGMLPGRRPRCAAMGAQGGPNLKSDRMQWAERAARVLRDERHVTAAPRPSPGLVERQQVLAVEQHLAAEDPPGWLGEGPARPAPNVLLPHPASPVSPTISPAATSRLTSLTAK